MPSARPRERVHLGPERVTMKQAAEMAVADGQQIRCPGDISAGIGHGEENLLGCRHDGGGCTGQAAVIAGTERALYLGTR
jgi:hypothetical protein